MNILHDMYDNLKDLHIAATCREKNFNKKNWIVTLSNILSQTFIFCIALHFLLSTTVSKLHFISTIP